ncbi:MAG: hypothetical protein KC636_36110 [Myxococcales bacterium]|nr:hypothetical protein [Myxococcales bacterium]
MLSRVLCVLSLALPAFACGDSTGGTGDCVQGDAPSFTEVDFSSCTHCHDSSKSGADRQAAPDSVNYDNYDDAKQNASQGAARVDNSSSPMPPATSDGPALSAEAKAQIIDWANCGTPQ